MKQLAALVVAVALAVSVVPSMTAAEETQIKPSPEAIALIEDTRGIDLSDWDYEVMVFEFELPPLATGFTATFDWSDNTLDVVPGLAVPAQESGDCLTAGIEFLSAAPLACGPGIFNGPIETSTLACVGTTICILDALDYFLFAFWFAECSGPTVGIGTHPGWSAAVGTCFVFYDSFGLPGQFIMWDAITGGIPAGTIYGAHN